MKENKNGIAGQVRQGDVLIEKVATPLEKGKVQKDRVLAHGEVTGHFHGVKSSKAKVYESPETRQDLDVKAMTTKEDTEIVHQEHTHIPIEAGDYRIVRQREYTPEAIRNVAD